MSLQQKIDRITDILRRDDGISGAMHYTEQTSWILFLKFLDDYEAEKADEAILSGRDYSPVLDEQHRWSSCGNVRLVEGDIWVTDNAFFIKLYLGDIYEPYIVLALQHLDLRKTANQAAQPVISYKGIRELQIPFPGINEQKQIVAHLDSLSERTRALEAATGEKLNDLTALKASLLDAAFKGQL